LPWPDRVPLLVATSTVAALLMLVPALFAGLTGDDDSARPFLYGGILFSSLSVLVGLATMTLPQGNVARGLLLSMVGTYRLLPVMLALPLLEAVPGLSLHNAYLEMVSSLTTTGATVFDRPDTIPDAVHLWRALVGWYGGFILWVAAISVLAPLRLGGFELMLTSAQVGRDGTLGHGGTTRRPMRRILRFVRTLGPVYAGLTFLAWLCLLIAGAKPFVAACHAMSALATSGISPLASLEDAGAGLRGEAVLFVFMAFGLSRSLFARDMPHPLARRWWQDPELRFAAALLAITTAVIFGHHWIGTLDTVTPRPPAEAARGLWGGLFTSMSFLTTTGFVSADWDTARNWSGLTTPGLILLGLAMVGGGVATTAGGVKLLRVYVLYKQGRFELSRLVHPSLVANPGHKARRFRLEQAYVAWLYFMLFAMSVAGIMLALSLTGIGLETALILTTAALTTTGPLTLVAGDAPIALHLLDPAAQLILGGAMVLGRLETLALVALFNPEFWRS